MIVEDGKPCLSSIGSCGLFCAAAVEVEGCESKRRGDDGKYETFWQQTAFKVAPKTLLLEVAIGLVMDSDKIDINECLHNAMGRKDIESSRMCRLLAMFITFIHNGRPYC